MITSRPSVSVTHQPFEPVIPSMHALQAQMCRHPQSPPPAKATLQSYPIAQRHCIGMTALQEPQLPEPLGISYHGRPMASLAEECTRYVHFSRAAADQNTEKKCIRHNSVQFGNFRYSIYEQETITCNLGFPQLYCTLGQAEHPYLRSLSWPYSRSPGLSAISPHLPIWILPP